MREEIVAEGTYSERETKLIREGKYCDKNIFGGKKYFTRRQSEREMFYRRNCFRGGEGDKNGRNNIKER